MTEPPPTLRFTLRGGMVAIAVLAALYAAVKALDWEVLAISFFLLSPLIMVVSVAAASDWLRLEMNLRDPAESLATRMIGLVIAALAFLLVGWLMVR